MLEEIWKEVKYEKGVKKNIAKKIRVRYWKSETPPWTSVNLPGSNLDNIGTETVMDIVKIIPLRSMPRTCERYT